MAWDKRYLDMMNQWFILKQEGKSIATYLRQKGYLSIAVYGMVIYGRHVIRELAETDIKVVYAIDQRKMNPYKGIEILQPVGELPSVDCVINTVISDHSNIVTALSHIMDVPVLSIEDVVFESYDWGN